MILVATAACAQQPENLCPNPGAEEGDAAPLGWMNEGGLGEWATDQAHSGARSLKLHQPEGEGTRGWTSDMIPVPVPGESQFMLSVWAKLDEVTGRNGAFIGFYHIDENGERIGQSGGITIGGNGMNVATFDWDKFIALSYLPPEVKGVRVNVRLYGATGTAWFDDIIVRVESRDPLSAPIPIRRGLRLGEPGACAIVATEGRGAQAEALQTLLRARGFDLPILAHDQTDLRAETRDLIIMGDLTTSKASELLYLNSYTYEDRWFPGADGYVLRPLINCLGTGANFLVIGASDEAGLDAGVAAFAEALDAAGEPWDLPLTVKPGPGWGGVGTLPWTIGGGRREMVSAVAYLKSGNLDYAREYREMMLALAAAPDDLALGVDAGVHLFWITQSQSWDLMHTCPVFSDEDRLTITNHLLRIMRSREGEGHVRPQRAPRENHATRSARAFYYAFRHFAKYYPLDLEVDLHQWRRLLVGFWAGPFATSRCFEDALSQHGLGGTLDNTLDIAFMEPEWSEEFFSSGRAHQMGERCIAISNNMGQTVLLGDTGAGDYATSVFSKLAWKLGDGRYEFMLNKHGAIGTTTDELLRGFDVGIEPVVPEDHIGLTVIPADDLFFHLSLRNTEGVDFNRAFDKLTFREGFDPDDEYIMVDGTSGGSHSYDDANTIGEFSAHGRRWLCEIDIFNGPTMSFHNAVTIAHNGLGDSVPTQSAEVIRSAEGERWAYTATRLPNYNACDWTRHTLWQPDRYTVVLDEMTALEPGQFSFVDGWRSLGAPTLTPGLLECEQDEVRRQGYVWSGASLNSQITDSSGKYHYVLGSYNAVLCRSDEVGDFIEMTAPLKAPDDYVVTLRTVDYTGRGIIQVSVDGRPLGEPIDMLHSAPPVITETRVGTLHLDAGDHTVRFTVVGKNPASDNYYMALQELNLAQATVADDPVVDARRFRLVFPASVPASLDRDHETLGKYLPTNRYRDQYLNILEQSMNADLQPGESACFVNVFYATEDPQRSVEMRRLNDHAALVMADGEPALIGAGADGTEIRAGDLRASGAMFFISPERVTLTEATATLAGQPLAEGVPADPAALRAALQTAWDAAATTATDTRPSPWADAPPLTPLSSAELADSPLTVEALRGGEGVRLAVGGVRGTVTVWDATGAAAGEMMTGGPVHALEAADLDGDGAQELLVGSDDANIYALSADLTELWRREIEFMKQTWGWWTLGTSKVRRIYADDITGDGTPELLLGVGNMRLHCLDASGEELWRFRTDHGICTTITTADFFGDGRNLVLAGNGLTSSAGTLWLLDAAGEVVKRYHNGSWCTALPAIAVGDLDGDGVMTAFAGNNRGDVRAWAPDSEYTVPLWANNLTRPIRSLTVLPGAVAVGSDSGYLCAFDQAGEKIWGLPLSSAITHTALARGQLVAGCKDGQVFVVTPGGELVGHHDLGARLRDMIVADVDGDGNDDIVAITSGPDRLVVITQRE
jgi:hypothetical protein